MKCYRNSGIFRKIYMAKLTTLSNFYLREYLLWITKLKIYNYGNLLEMNNDWKFTTKKINHQWAIAKFLKYKLYHFLIFKWWSYKYQFCCICCHILITIFVCVKRKYSHKNKLYFWFFSESIKIKKYCYFIRAFLS